MKHMLITYFEKIYVNDVEAMSENCEMICVTKASIHS